MTSLIHHLLFCFVLGKEAKVGMDKRPQYICGEEEGTPEGVQNTVRENDRSNSSRGKKQDLVSSGYNPTLLSVTPGQVTLQITQ